MIDQAEAADMHAPDSRGKVSTKSTLLQRVRKSKLNHKIINPAGMKAYHEDKKPADVFSLRRLSALHLQQMEELLAGEMSQQDISTHESSQREKTPTQSADAFFVQKAREREQSRIIEDQ
jgi:hypothetical protein